MQTEAGTHELEIRPLRPDEIERVVRLWKRSRADAQPWLEQRMGYSDADDLAHFRERVMCENQIWIAARAGVPVGFLALHDEHLELLYVDPPLQGSGVGSALLRRAKKLAPARLSLYTHQRNQRARRFYERHGFRPLGFGVSPAPESEPDVCYRWTPEAP